MLEKTDNDLPKANDENVSEEASIPNAKKEDETTEKPTQPPVEAVTEEQAEKAAPAPEKKQEETVEPIEEPVEAVQDASETEEEAETKEDDATTEAERSEQVFDGMEPKKMLEYFSEALGNKPIQSLKSTVDALTKAFEKEMASLKDTQRQAFIAEGGNPDAFYFNPPVLKEFNNLIRRYKSDRGTYYRSVEEKQQKSLEQRLALIEELKGLIGVDQDINTTYKQFKDLQRRWKETGQVPRMEANNIWKTYHHHVGHFYDFLHLNRELRELDFKFNLEQKLKICEQAEALASMEDIPKGLPSLTDTTQKMEG
jgi:hypothetical protein